MIHPSLNLDELDARPTVMRLAAVRAQTRPLPAVASSSAPNRRGQARHRLGAALIAIGERIGGPAPGVPQPLAPLSGQTPAPSG